MKLICEGLDLSDAVLKVIKATATRTTNPILEGIKLRAGDDTLTLSATDLEISIEKTIPADVKIEGEVVVPGKFFADFVKKLSGEQIELSLTDNNSLKIQYTDSEGFLQCMNAEEFPEIKDLVNPERVVLKQKDLKDLITKTIFSVAVDDARPILKGCLFEISNDTITAVALDGYRVAICKKKIKSTTAEFSTIVPARTLGEIAKLLEGEDNDDIELLIQKNYLMVNINDTRVITRLLEGDFINYKPILAQSVSSTILVNKKQLEYGLERASLLARMDKNNLVKLDIRDNLLTLTSASDIGNVTENITVKLDGKDIVIAFNVRYMSECMRIIEDDFIKITFSSPTTPCTILPSEGDEYLFLILPVRIVS